jgi:competence protein ComEA
MSSFIKEYFTFTRSQSNAVLALLFLIMVASLFYFFMPNMGAKKQQPIEASLRHLQLSIVEDIPQYGYEAKSARPIAKLKPFSFNPNTLDEVGFKRMGLPDKLVATILNFRNKGGKFYNKESLKRMYGLYEEEYKQLAAYVNIPNPYTSKSNLQTKPLIHIELNTADTASLIKLRGIGSKLAMNIVRLRENLGGFSNMEQLKEVFGISDETFKIIAPSIEINKSKIKKLNLNAATYYELNAHPYLRGDIATAIVAYRKAHDYKINKLSQLREIPLINEGTFRKISPYLGL